MQLIDKILVVFFINIKKKRMKIGDKVRFLSSLVVESLQVSKVKLFWLKTKMVFRFQQ